MEHVFYEATSTFTFVATRKFAHPAIQGFVDGLQKATFPSPPAIQLHGFGFLPWRDLHPQVCAALRWARQEERPDPIGSIAMFERSHNFVLRYSRAIVAVDGSSAL